MLYLKKGTVGIDFYTGSELQIKFVVHGEKISCGVPRYLYNSTKDIQIDVVIMIQILLYMSHVTGLLSI